LIARQKPGGSTLGRPAVTFAEYMDIMREHPVYVVLGVQGSGTNLLSRLLGRIFGFSVLHDRSMVFNAAARLGCTPQPDDVAREIQTFKTSLARSEVARKLEKGSRGHDSPFEGVFTELQASAVRNGHDFARLIYTYRAFSLGAREMAIKSDDIWEHLDAIDTVLPNRRIILLTRDFRDNLLSIGGKHFGPVEPICAAQYVKRQFQLYDAEYRRSGDRGFHVRFETLVEEPRRFVEEFSQHYGLSPAVNADAALEAFPFRPNKVAKWKLLDAQTLNWCEGLLETELRTYGYALASSAPTPPSFPVVMAARARDTIKRIPQKLRILSTRLGMNASI
jgi:hypothetical protein